MTLLQHVIPSHLVLKIKMVSRCPAQILRKTRFHLRPSQGQFVCVDEHRVDTLPCQETRLLFDELIFCLQRLYCIPFHLDMPFNSSILEEITTVEVMLIPSLDLNNHFLHCRFTRGESTAATASVPGRPPQDQRWQHTCTFCDSNFTILSSLSVELTCAHLTLSCDADVIKTSTHSCHTFQTFRSHFK